MTTHKHILIIEDQEPLRKALVSTFLKNNYQVTEAADGIEGLRVALTEQPHLILLDIMMPKLGGLAMLKELRKDRWGKDAKVMLLTNMLDDEEMLDQAQDLGVKTYLLKAEWSLKDVIEKAKEELELAEVI